LQKAFVVARASIDEANPSTIVLRPRVYALAARTMQLSNLGWFDHGVQ
jgi:hypothetical protein